jgi:hypothetical protein
VESIGRSRAMRSRIGQWVDDLHLLDDRARPPVGDDHRQRVLVSRSNMNEVNIEPINLGDEVGQSIQTRFRLAPVVLCRPITRELLDGREPHALGVVGDLLFVGPAGRRDATAKIDEVRFRNVDAKGANGVAFTGGGGICRQRTRCTRGR